MFDSSSLTSLASMPSLPSFESLSNSANNSSVNMLDLNNNSSNSLNLNMAPQYQHQHQQHLHQQQQQQQLNQQQNSFQQHSSQSAGSFISKPLKLINNLKNLLTMSTSPPVSALPQTSSSSSSSHQSQLVDSLPPSPSPTNPSGNSIFFLPTTNSTTNLDRLQNNFYNHGHGSSTIFMHKFEYNPNILYDNLQNIIEKNFTNDGAQPSFALSQSQSQTISPNNSINMNLNLEELSRIKLEDIDQLNSSTPPSNNASNSSFTAMYLRKNDSLQKEFDYDPSNSASSRSRSSSIVNMIYNFCKGSSTINSTGLGNAK